MKPSKLFAAHGSSQSKHERSIALYEKHGRRAAKAAVKQRLALACVVVDTDWHMAPAAITWDVSGAGGIGGVGGSGCGGGADGGPKPSGTASVTASIF